MEDFIIQLKHEVKNDPLTTLNIVMAVFTVVSFTRLCSDIIGNLCCKKTHSNKTDNVLSLIKKTNLVVEELETGLSNIDSKMERMENYLSQIHFQICANAKDESQSHADSQSQTDSQLHSSPNSPTPTNSVITNQELEPVKAQSPPKDKHAQLIDVLNDGDTVSMTYKKQTFNATFKVKAGSQHGYVLQCGTVEYNTPSHFSHAKKVSINDKIKSDNGWDTVYVLNDNKKVCLNDLLAQ